MTRLLHAPVVDSSTRRLDAPALALDQATRDLVARAESDAYARGRADGAQDAAEASRTAAARATTALEVAVEQAHQHLQEACLAQAQEVVTVARQLAEAVLGQELQAGGPALIDRVLAAVDVLDHGPFEVRMAPVDHDQLSECRLPGDTTLVADAALKPGEARIVGPWSEADLTLGAVLETLAEGAR